jgi:agmatine deiminase
MPAEWEPHAATWLAWPHYHGDWPGKFEPIPWVYTEIIRNLARHERVELIVNDAAAERQIRKLLDRANAALENVRFHRWPTNRVWLRDSGAIFVSDSCGSDTPVRGLPLASQTLAGNKALETHDFSSKPALSMSKEPALSMSKEPALSTSKEPALSTSKEPALSTSKGAVNDSYQGTALAVPQPAKTGGALAPEALLALNFRFNAWAKYSNYRHDAKISALMSSVARAEKILPFSHQKRVVLEGGSIDVNGCGTILTTEECLLSKVQQRNPGMSRKDYEKMFADYLGAPHVIWLGRGICGDDTHGHVDDLTRFVAPDTVVTMVEPNRKDINHKPLRENLRRLHAARDQAGKPLNIVELPMPGPVVFEQRRLPASYANFYIANGIVLVPVFNDPNDRIALNTLAALFPTRQVVPIYSGDLVWGLGTMHCMTQQQPAL